MDLEKLRKRFIPMSETMFYILSSLQEERHGYGHHAACPGADKRADCFGGRDGLLEKMAQEGWQADRIRQFDSFSMTFQKKEPRKYRYVFDLNAFPILNIRILTGNSDGNL